MQLRTRIWNQLRSPELAQARDAGAVVLLPTGSIEQHARHLPVDTDILCATSVCRRVAETLDDPPVLVVEAVSVGFSEHHLAHPGTVSLRLETFLAVIRDVVTSIRSHGFKKILIVNGHGGNIAPLRAIGAQLTTDGHAVAVCSYWDFVTDQLPRILDGDLKEVGHACEFETSLLLYLREAGVAMSEAVRDMRPPWNPDLDRDDLEAAGVVFPPVFRKHSTGLKGDPTKATAEKGREIFDIVVANLRDFIRKFAQVDLGQ